MRFAVLFPRFLEFETPAQYLAIGFKGTGRHWKGRFFAPLFDYALGPSTSVDPKNLDLKNRATDKRAIAFFTFIIVTRSLTLYLSTILGNVLGTLVYQTRSAGMRT